jgi:ribonuclease J
VIVSASPIPGNETSVYRIINKLFRSGAEVIYQSRALVHVSGHASRDEIIDMLRMVGPRHVLPFHGEHRHMALYADIAVENGIPPSNITFAECGDVIEITQDRVRVTDHVEAGFVYVDGMSVAQSVSRLSGIARRWRRTAS